MTPWKGWVSGVPVVETTIDSSEIEPRDRNIRKELEQCASVRIRMMKFPEPKDGGSCIVNSTLIVKAAEEGGEGK